jgi:hypothetical protein
MEVLMKHLPFIAYPKLGRLILYFTQSRGKRK